MNITTPDPGQETETEVVWLHLKVFWHSKDNSAGHGEGRKKKIRQKWWEGSIKEWTGMNFASITRAVKTELY